MADEPDEPELAKMARLLEGALRRPKSALPSQPPQDSRFEFEASRRGDVARAAEQVEQASNKAVPDAKPTPVAGHDPLPGNWIEAVPIILFGFYGLAFAFEAVGAMNRGDIGIFIADTVGCVFCAAIALAWWKRREWLPQKLVTTSIGIATDARWLLSGLSVLLIASALAPYVEQRRWPFSAWFPIVVHEASPSEADIQNYLRTHPLQQPAPAASSQLKLGPLAAIAMAQSLAKVPGHWIVYFTHAPENFGLRDTLIGIMRAYSDPWIMEAPDASIDLDAPKFPPPSSEPGITLHGVNALNDRLASVLGTCFIVRHTDKELAGLEDWQNKRLSPQERAENRQIAWIEIGRGSPWRTRGPLDNCLH